MLTDRIQTIAKGAFFYHPPLFVEHDVLAHLVAQIDPDGLGFLSRYRFAILLHGWFSYAVLSTTTWFSSFARRRNCTASGSRRSRPSRIILRQNGAAAAPARW